MPDLPQAASAWVFDDAGRVLLVRDNYDRRRFGPPGGAIDVGESPLEAAVREFREETCAEFEPNGVLGVYHFVYPNGRTYPWLSFCFAGAIRGEPRLPSSGEIAELGWFSPDSLPEPTTNLLRHVLPDARQGRRGVYRVVQAE